MRTRPRMTKITDVKSSTYSSHDSGTIDPRAPKVAPKKTQARLVPKQKKKVISSIRLIDFVVTANGANIGHECPQGLIP
jgi:hypothetical protein